MESSGARHCQRPSSRCGNRARSSSSSLGPRRRRTWHPAEDTMRAVVITHAGGPEALAIRDVELPQPGPGEILVRVRATALNRADVLQREGRYPAPPGAPPDIPGLEFAGEVAANGSGATRWPVGARVFGIVGGGSYAEHLVTSQDTVAEIPAGMSWVDAAAIPEAFITAHDAMIT